LEWLLSSDAFVAEVTTPSLGVGYEARCAVERKIPALLLARKGTLVSAMLLGSDWLKTWYYSSEREAKGGIDNFMLSLQQT